MKILPRKLINNNLLFIDGTAKSGKVVISTIISSFKNTQNQVFKWRYNNMLKYSKEKLIDKSLAIDWILQDIQISEIENHISRYTNFRKHDLSSINNSYYAKNYKKNLKIKDNDLEINKIIQKIKKEKPIYPLVVDDFFPICLKNANQFLKYKKIIMLKNPIIQLFDLIKRKRIEKIEANSPWKIDHKIFFNGKVISWNLINNTKLKKINNIYDKYLLLLQNEINNYLNPNILKFKKTKIVFIEDVWSNPKKTVVGLEKFLNTKKSLLTNKILAKLSLPRNKQKIYDNAYKFIQNKLSNNQKKIIFELEKKYLYLKNHIDGK